MSAIGVTGDVALRATPRVLAAKGQHVAAMTAPVRANVGDGLEPMRDTVVDFLGIVVLIGRKFSRIEDVLRIHVPRYLIWKCTL